MKLSNLALGLAFRHYSPSISIESIFVCFSATTAPNTKWVIIVAMTRKIGPNEPCPCGSGKKYKKCCWSKRFQWLVDEQGNVYRRIPLDDPDLFDQTMKAFRERHGREPDPHELIFRDLGHPEYVEAVMVNVMKRAGIPPALIYAYEKTGRIVTEQNKDKLTDAELDEWIKAVEEYHRRVEQGDEPSI